MISVPPADPCLIYWQHSILCHWYCNHQILFIFKIAFVNFLTAYSLKLQQKPHQRKLQIRITNIREELHLVSAVIKHWHQELEHSSLYYSCPIFLQESVPCRTPPQEKALRRSSLFLLQTGPLVFEEASCIPSSTLGSTRSQRLRACACWERREINRNSYIHYSTGGLSSTQRMASIWSVKGLRNRNAVAERREPTQ